MAKILLASSSKYRRQLIEKLGITVLTGTPDIDETPFPSESAHELVARLSRQKAEALAEHHPDTLIIGSDQVAEMNGQILTKPGNFDNACSQLRQCSGQQATFYTGIALHNTCTGITQHAVDLTEVHFRKLSPQQINNYVLREQPYDCAGSFKAEGLGIVLFEFIRSNDPNSLIGLPLITLVTLLTNEGIELL